MHICMIAFITVWYSQVVSVISPHIHIYFKVIIIIVTVVGIVGI